MQPVMLRALTYSIVMVLLVIWLSFQAIQLLSLGSYWLAIAYSTLAFWTFWSFGSIPIETAVAFRIKDLERTNDYAAAELFCVRAALLWQALHLPRDGRYGLFCSNIALTQGFQGKYESAEFHLREAVRLVEQHPALSRHELFAVPINNLALVCAIRGKYTEAEHLAKKALEISLTGKAGESSGAALPLFTLSLTALKLERLEEAEEYLFRAENLLSRLPAPYYMLRQSVDNAQVSCQLALALLRAKQDRMDDSVALAKNIVEGFQHNQLELSTNHVQIVAELAEILMIRNEPTLAEYLLERAYAVVIHQSNHPDALLLQNVYSKLLTMTNRAIEIPDMQRWVRPVLIEDPLLGS